MKLRKQWVFPSCTGVKYFSFLLFFSALHAFGSVLNIATPSKHPYVLPKEGRSAYSLPVKPSTMLVFMTSTKGRPITTWPTRTYSPRESSPPTPGWMPACTGTGGKYNQNGHNDGRWNDGRHRRALFSCGQRFPKISMSRKEPA